jgi:hypothetical protein
MSNKALKRALKAHVSRQIGAGRAIEYQGLIDAQGGVRRSQDSLGQAGKEISDAIQSLGQEAVDSDPGRKSQIQAVIREAGGVRQQINAATRALNNVAKSIGKLPKV